MTPYQEDLKIITRRIHTKLILNYHTARAVIEWLEDKVETLETEGMDPMMFDDGGDFQH